MHLHIISVGESVHKTFPIALKNLNNITHAWVFVEEGIYLDNPDDDEQYKDTKINIRGAIAKLKIKCEEDFVEFREIRVASTSLIYIRDSVLSNLNNTKYSKLSFNLSGGTKMLSLSLFVMAIWLDAEVYLTPRGGGIEKIAIPKMHLADIRKNQNYIHGLRILDSINKNNLSENRNEKWMSGKDFARKLSEKYETVRFADDNKIKKTPNKGTISKIKSQLEEWSLIEERNREGSKKEKEYRITEDGIFALSILNSEENKK